MSNINKVIERLTDYSKGKAGYKSYDEFQIDLRDLIVFATLQIRANEERERISPDSATVEP